MLGVITTPLDVMSAITDRALRSVEAMDIDQVYVTMLNFNFLLRTCQVGVVFGGLDSALALHPVDSLIAGAGRTQPTPLPLVAYITIPDPDFTTLFTDVYGNPLSSLSVGDLNSLFTNYIMPYCQAQVWHFDDIEVSISASVVFKVVAGVQTIP